MATKKYELKLTFTADLSNENAFQIVEEMKENAELLASEIEQAEDGISEVVSSFTEV